MVKNLFLNIFIDNIIPNIIYKNYAIIFGK